MMPPDHGELKPLIGLVHREAYRIARRVPSHILVDDLISAGLVGLADALAKNRSADRQELIRYAIIRVRGAIWDSLRHIDTLSRGARADSNRHAISVRVLTAELGRPPTDAEVAARLGLSREELFNALQTWQPVELCCFDDEGDVAIEIAGHAPSADESLTCHEGHEKLWRAVRTLPERHRRIVEWYYRDELLMSEIGSRLGLTESRVCQVHGEAIRMLRASMTVKSEWNAA